MTPASKLQVIQELLDSDEISNELKHQIRNKFCDLIDVPKRKYYRGIMRISDGSLRETSWYPEQKSVTVICINYEYIIEEKEFGV